MRQIYKKRECFGVEIRRSHREKLFLDKRSSFVNEWNFNQSCSEFFNQRPHEAPQILLDLLQTQSTKSIQIVGDQLGKLPLFFSESDQKHPQDWFLECTSKNNLKLFILLVNQTKEHDLINNFFKATLVAHRNYVNISNSYILDAQPSRCYIRPMRTSLENLKQQNLLQKVYNSTNEERFLTTLKFWSTVLSKSFDFHFTSIVVMVKTFLIWHEHTDISKYPEAYSFSAAIIQFIKQIKKAIDFKFKEKWEESQVQKSFHLLVEKMSTSLPYALSHFDFQELGQMTIVLIQVEEVIPNALQSLRLRSETVVGYLKRIFKLPLQTINLDVIITGIRLTCYLFTKCSFFNFNSEGGKALLLKLFNDYLYESQLRSYTLFTLKCFAYDDLSMTMKSYFENIDYQLLLNAQIYQHQGLIFQFCNTVLQAYRQNNIISTKLLKNSNYVAKIVAYSSGPADDEEIFIAFVKIISSSLAYFVDNWMEEVRKTRDYVFELNFEGRPEFLKESSQYIELKVKESQI